MSKNILIYIYIYIHTHNTTNTHITPLRHERMRKWLNLDSTREATVRKGRVGDG